MTRRPVWPEEVKPLSRVWLFATHWAVAYEAPPPWDFPGKSAGMGCHFLLQGIFPTQGSNPGLPYCRQMLYCLSHPGSPETGGGWAEFSRVDKYQSSSGLSRQTMILFKVKWRELPGGPEVKTSPSSAEGAGSVPGQGAKIPHASWPKKKNKKKNKAWNRSIIVTNSIKAEKNGPHLKKKVKWKDIVGDWEETYGI